MARFFTLRIWDATSNSGNVKLEWRLTQDDEHGKGWNIYINGVYIGIQIFKPLMGRPSITIDNKVMADHLPVDLQNHYYKPPSGSYVKLKEETVFDLDEADHPFWGPRKYKRADE